MLPHFHVFLDVKTRHFGRVPYLVGQVFCFAVSFLFGRIQSPIQIIFLKRSSVVQEMGFGGRLFPWQR